MIYGDHGRIVNKNDSKDSNNEEVASLSDSGVKTIKRQMLKGSSVFIIHGHDTSIKTEVQLLLLRANITNVVLHEVADKGRTIIDKLIEETSNTHFAIAILSPDDLLHNGAHRARQNVILEIGFFLGKLGKERVRMLVKDNIEIPSDLQGILYEKHDLEGVWKTRILKELDAAGVIVNWENLKFL